MSQYIKPLEQCLHTRRMEDKRRILRFIVAALFMALWAYGAATIGTDAGCGGDWDCEQQCLEQLQPDEDPSVCEVQLGSEQ